jgi:hypothetical protein
MTARQTPRQPSRQPRLHWIKEVLADLAADRECAPASRGIVRPRGTMSADVQSSDAPLAETDGEERLFCASWQSIRLAVTPNA